MTYHPYWNERPGVDLIDQPIRTDAQDYNTKNNNTWVQQAWCEVFFRDIEHELIQKIRESDVVFGAVAWLTNLDILAELAKKSVVIVVQKEDFLRPDKATWAQLHAAYGRLHNRWDRYDIPGMVSNLSSCSDPSLDAIRCVGNHNRTKKPAFPRMHNKFVIFGKRYKFWEHVADAGDAPDCDDWCRCGDCLCHDFELTGVWTGSFNFTQNSTRSLENAVYIHDKEISQAYFDEWSQIFALSEPLNWEEDWCCPEYRIGT
jgi:hypothetical protein